MVSLKEGCGLHIPEVELKMFCVRVLRANVVLCLPSDTLPAYSHRPVASGHLLTHPWSAPKPSCGNTNLTIHLMILSLLNEGSQCSVNPTLSGVYLVYVLSWVWHVHLRTLCHVVFYTLLFG